ncbi:MAG: DUF480 domain-containing protein, partial [Burkholderiales bacterium]
VAELPRLPGVRENRWAHLLSGTPAARPQAAEDVSVDDVAALRADVARLEGEVRELRELVGRLAAK